MKVSTPFKFLFKNLVAYRADLWLGTTYIKNIFIIIKKMASDIFTIRKPETTMTLDEMLQNNTITEKDIDDRLIDFNRLIMIYFVMSLGLFLYLIFLIINHYFLSSFIVFGIMMYPLSLAFRYHFWSYQIKTRKFNCTLRDWWENK